MNKGAVCVSVRVRLLLATSLPVLSVCELGVPSQKLGYDGPFLYSGEMVILTVQRS